MYIDVWLFQSFMYYIKFHSYSFIFTVEECNNVGGMRKRNRNINGDNSICGLCHVVTGYGGNGWYSWEEKV